MKTNSGKTTIYPNARAARLSRDTIRKKDFLLSAVSGFLLSGSFPKVGLAGCAWFALVPLLVAIKDHSARNSFKLGFMAGLVHFTSLLYWLVYTMQTYGNLPLYLSLFVLALFSAYLSFYVGGFTWLLVRLNLRPMACFASMPVLWVSQECLRSYLLSGFPWALIGHSQYEILPLVQVSDLAGVYGISFVIVLCNAFIFLGILHLSRIAWQGCQVTLRSAAAMFVISGVIVFAVWFYGKHRIDSTNRSITNAETARISIVQGNIDQSQKWNPAFQQATIEKYARYSLAARKAQPDLIVWPETATPFYLFHQPLLTAMVIQGIRRTGTDFLIGSPSFRPVNKTIGYYNSAYLISSQGKIAGRYDKVHLVPFGEYVPFKRWLPFLGKMVENVGDFKAGSRGQALSWRRLKIGTLICFEIIFPQLSRAMAHNRAAFLVNLTNDAWFGKSGGPYQHFSMAIFRAIENRRALVRSANTGISAIIDPVGRVIARTKLDEEAVMTGEVPILKEKTLYTRFGDLFAVICLILTLLILSRQQLSALKKTRFHLPDRRVKKQKNNKPN